MRRNKEKMKYWGFYLPERLKAETINCAITANESDSEYIRKAVEERNVRYKFQANPKDWVVRVGNAPDIELGIAGETNKPDAADVIIQAITKPTIPDLKEKVKQMEKPKMIKSFMKGEK